jgi:hypothetical protein
MAKSSFLLWIGVAIAVAGAVGFMYGAYKFQDLAASKGPVFSEADVPKIPDSAKAFVPLEAGTGAMIVVGIGIAAFGHSGTLNKSSNN